jgi:hypothetical protein
LTEAGRRADPVRLLPLLLVVAFLAGCADAPYGAPSGAAPGFRLSGSFDKEATQQDYDRAQGIAASHGGTMALLESFPVQYVVSGLTDVACQKVREALQKEPHVASVGVGLPAGGA